MAGSNEFLLLLEKQDIRGLRRAWAKASPHLPQPKSKEEAEIVMHHARTLSNSLSLKHRAYSHKWLLERTLPSGLPEELRPSAERMYPVVVEGVGITLDFKNKYMKPAVPIVRGAMETKVLEIYGDVRPGQFPDAAVVKTEMNIAREKAMNQLFGKL